MDLKNKKIIVTGADGFIGSHLVEYLLSRDYNVRAFVFYNSFNSWGWLDTINKNLLSKAEIFAGDIRDAYGVLESITGIDVVFHLAALIGIPFSYYSPDAYVETNIRGTLNVLQAAKHHNVQRVVITSTSEVYGSAIYTPMDENHPLQPQSPYSATKIASDAMAESFYRSFSLPVVIARPFNTYGPRQSLRAVIPTIITQILCGNNEIMLGSIEPLRDFNYVSDTCNGLTAIAECDAAVGKCVNIGSGKEISIGYLVEIIKETINPAVKIVCDQARKRHKNSEVDRLLCDSTLMTNLTGWQSEISFKNGIQKTIEWFKIPANLNKYKEKFNKYNV
ncbi:nucleotide sugar dehydratase [Candidatus Magnetobacterium bavaricum]|uniref:Nucleotide sugar dehydratase n=1 Tax=Candidatus Magnetobacterium bavaricum TaxID=29290 RepID=A0A0F3GL19_9BACT|nr:nucleotide sugar dehydratase [Candidatus Magnetobacterium bavaricum]